MQFALVEKARDEIYLGWTSVQAQSGLADHFNAVVASSTCQAWRETTAEILGLDDDETPAFNSGLAYFEDRRSNEIRDIRHDSESDSDDDDPPGPYRRLDTTEQARSTHDAESEPDTDDDHGGSSPDRLRNRTQADLGELLLRQPPR